MVVSMCACRISGSGRRASRDGARRRLHGMASCTTHKKQKCTFMQHSTGHTARNEGSWTHPLAPN